MTNTDPLSPSSQVRRRRVFWAALVALAVVAVFVVWVLGMRASGPNPVGGATTPSVPPVSTILPTPTPGSTEVIDKPADLVVDLGQSAEPVAGVMVAVNEVTHETVGDDGAGVVAGPAVRVEITVTNASSDALDLSGASVNLAYNGDDRLPGAIVDDTEAATWPESLAVGESTTRTFLFATPGIEQADMRVTVDLLAEVSDVTFVGEGKP